MISPSHSVPVSVKSSVVSLSLSTKGLSNQAGNFIRLNRIRTKAELRELIAQGRVFPYCHHTCGVKTAKELYKLVGETYNPPKTSNWYEVFNPSTGRCLLRAKVTSLEELKLMLTDPASVRRLLMTRNFGMTHLKEINDYFESH